MKKKHGIAFPYWKGKSKFVRVMKLLAFLLFAGFLQVSANIYSQTANIRLAMEKASLGEIIQEIQRQTEFVFFYSTEDIRDVDGIKVDVKKASLEEALDVCLEGTDLTYQIKHKAVILKRIPQTLKGLPAKISVEEDNKKTINGSVKDESGNPIPGASVIIKGTTTGTITDIDGEFELKIPESAKTLVVNFVGLKSQEVTIGDKSQFKIVLEEESFGIDEVVAVGYGTMKKSDLTGSVVSVQSEQITQTLSTTIEQTLSGRASGVQVTQTEGAPGAGVKIRVRGGTSINASNEPLYVIDGFPIDGGSGNDVTAGIGISKTSVLSTMNPNDIESIEILKDASATAIYGSRGANGVILITTKSGGGNRQNINFSASYGLAHIPKKLEVLSGDDFIEYYNEIGGGLTVGSFRKDYAIRDENGDVMVDYVTWNGREVWKMGTADMFTQHDWQDELFRTAPIQDYTLSFSGGTKKLDYLASFGYYTQDGTIIGSSFERYTGNFKLTNKFSDKFSISVNFNAGYTVNDGILSATAGPKYSSGVITNMILFRPVYGYDSYGVLVTDMTTDSQTFDITNPMKLATEQENLSKTLSVRPNISMVYEIIPGLEFNVRMSANMSNGKVKSWYPAAFGRGLQVGGGLAILKNSNEVSWLNDNLLTYKKTFSDHKIDVVAGYSQQGSSYEYFSLAKSNFEIQSINVDNIGSGTEFQPGNSGSSLTDWGLRSWLGRANYTYKERYLLTFTGRADGASNFPPGHKWSFFPSGAFAWRIAQEPFMNNIEEIDDLKLHVSYGESGNRAISSYASLAKYGFDNYTFDGNAASTGLYLNRLENNSLSWETTKQVDVGLDLTMFNSRLNLNAVYYSKLTDDLLLEAKVPLTTGFEDAWKNVGSIENKGMEFTLNTVNIQTSNFSWTTNFNISFNKNMVKRLATDNDLDYFIITGPGSGSDDYIVKVGEEVGSMYGYVWDGVYQLDQFTWNETKYDPLVNDHQLRNIPSILGGYKLKDGELTISGQTVLPGNQKFKDIAGAFDEDGNPIPDGTINAEDRTIIGHASPKHYGGLANNFTYKNFDLSILLNWSYGNDIYNKNLAEGLSLGDAFRNQYKTALDRWHPNNPTNDLWMIGGASFSSTTFLIEDGSFLRLSNVTLGYNLPQSILDKWKVSNARIYLSGDNLHVWTKYSGYDPEVSVGDNALTPGIDFGAYPRSRTIRLGIKLDF